MTTNACYNGWKNRATWNCVLWISNDEGLYRSAREFMRKYKGRAPYRAFIDYMGLAADKNPDGIRWIGRNHDYNALNSTMREFCE